MNLQKCTFILLLKVALLLFPSSICQSQVTDAEEYSWNPVERTVEFGFLPRELASIDSAKQTVSVVGLLTALWIDNRAEYNPATAWKPKVLLLNVISDDKVVLSPEHGISVVNYSDTVVRSFTTWPRTFKFSCDFEMRLFPLDQHICTLQLMATEIALPDVRFASVVSQSSIEIGNSLYSGNSEWQLLGFSLKNGTLKSGPGSDGFSIFNAEFRIKRRPTYYFVVVGAPLLLLTTLQLLTYMVPLASGEKISCGVTVMLSFTMFLVLIDNIVPKSSDVPTLLYFIVASMAVSVMSLFLNSVLLRMHHAGVLAPHWLLRALSWVSCNPRNRRNLPISTPDVLHGDDDDISNSKDKRDLEDEDMSLAEAAAVLERGAMIVHFSVTVVLVGLYFIVSLAQ